jgi:hypothetical protein
LPERYFGFHSRRNCEGVPAGETAVSNFFTTDLAPDRLMGHGMMLGQVPAERLILFL